MKALPPAVVLLAALATTFPWGCAPERTPEDRGDTPPVLCDIDAGPCRARAGEVTVILDISPRPVRTMTDLTFHVTASAAGLPVTDAAVAVELTMPGMVMGENRIMQ